MNIYHIVRYVEFGRYVCYCGYQVAPMKPEARKCLFPSQVHEADKDMAEMNYEHGRVFLKWCPDCKAGYDWDERNLECDIS